MLEIIVPEREYFDQLKGEFMYSKQYKLVLEHSLISISKWESKWKKPFLSAEAKSREETLDYIKCMSVSNIPDYANLESIPNNLIREISEYIDDTMTATWFNNDKNRSPRGGKGQVITSELIYYWMIAYDVPFECQKWHLNRLLTLIRICEIKNAPSKKMKKKDIYAQNRALNAARRNSLGTKG